MLLLRAGHVLVDDAEIRRRIRFLNHTLSVCPVLVRLSADDLSRFKLLALVKWLLIDVGL